MEEHNDCEIRSYIFDEKFFQSIKKIQKKTGMPMVRVQKIIEKDMLKKHDESIQ